MAKKMEKVIQAEKRVGKRGRTKITGLVKKPETSHLKSRFPNRNIRHGNTPRPVRQI